MGYLYQDNPYEKMRDRLPDDMREHIEDIFARQYGSWNENLIYGELTEQEIRCMKQVAPMEKAELFPHISDRDAYAGFFAARGYAEYERKRVLNHIAGLHPVDFYNGGDDLSVLKGVNTHGRIDYNNTVPKVYFSSKINLNLTLRSIRSGVPLRAFDVMGIGGFLMSNYQAEFEELYEVGHDMVMFSSLEEMEDLLAFYLSHERERLNVCLNGYKKTAAEHTVNCRIRSMLETVYGRQ